MKIKLVFHDWTKGTSDESIYNTEEGIELSLGDFRHGTIFDATIDVPGDEKWLTRKLREGYKPVFYAVEQNVRQHKQDVQQYKQRILVLEDNEYRIKWFRHHFANETITIMEAASDAIGCLQSNEYDLIFLDHDLGGEAFVNEAHKNTGSEVARFLAASKANINASYVIHSLNSAGADYMFNALINAGYQFVFKTPFTRLISERSEL